jgi:hypothetical protein
MKIVALVLGLIGSLVLVGVGATWASEYNKFRRSEVYELIKERVDAGTGDASAREAIATAESLGRAGNLAFGLGGLAFLASLFTVKFPRVAAAVMALAVVVPSVFVPKLLGFGALLALGAVVAFVAGGNRRPAALPVAQPAEAR